jgi:hypothetical protein
MHSLNSLVRLGPLIKAGIVRPIIDSECICPNCRGAAVPNYARVEKKARAFWREQANQFRVVYRPLSDDEAELEVTGPREFIPHRMLISVPRSSVMDSMRQKVIDGVPGVVLPRIVVKREHILSRFAFPEFISDLVTQQLDRANMGACYLTDSEGQATFFENMRIPQQGIHEAQFWKYLAHSIPLFSQASIKGALKLRKSEPEAFIRYRASLNQIARQYDGKLSDHDARQLYHDVLRPRISELQTASKNAARLGIHRLATKLSVSAFVISIGVIGGLLPKEIRQLFAAVGGFKMLSDISESAFSIERRPNEVRNHELYFLLRLSEAGRLPH